VTVADATEFEIDPDADGALNSKGTQKPAEAGDQFAQLDRELDLKHDLVELNQARDENKQAMQERLYELHRLMAGTGRAGKFTPFLRNELEWPEKNAYDKAMRWVAAHQLRIGEIDEETYRSRTGNGNGSTTLRSDSSAAPAGRPVAPAFKQLFNVDVNDEAPALKPPTYKADEITADAQALEKRKNSFHSTILLRAQYPVGFAAWLRSAWKLQARRHGTRTFADTMAATFLIGWKSAAEDDEWGQCLDEILHDIGRDPSSALRPDFVHPEDRENAPADATVIVADLVVTAEEDVQPVNPEVCHDSELTLDDFDDNVLGFKPANHNAWPEGQPTKGK
jgi:hypothetical protein